MGSTPSERRALLELITLDVASVHHRTTSPLLHLVAGVQPRATDVELGFLAFDDHPADVLPRYDDLARWWAIVLSSRGTAHFLDQPDGAPEPIVSTFARSRDGHEISLLRRGDQLDVLPGRGEGRIPDLLRTLLPTERRARP